MNAQKLEKKTREVIDDYIADLDHYTFEQILMKPSAGSWSVGQVYVHLWMSAKGFFFKKADDCLTAQGAEKGKRKNWKAMFVFAIGRMPDIRVRMPEKVAIEPRQPESKEQLISKLNEIKELSTSYIHRLSGGDDIHKARHPILGYLNAQEWVALCNMHFHHHLRQIKRIRRHFGWK